MTKLLVGIFESEKDKSDNIDSFLTENFTRIEFEIKILTFKANLESEQFLISKKIDLLISSYEKELSKSLEDKTFLVTSLPLIKSDTLSLKTPFGKDKNLIKFLRSREDLIQILSPHFGKVWFIGAGAGNKELITVKGRKRVGEADVVISDHLLDQDILKTYVRHDALIISLTRFGSNNSTQSEINETILRYALLERRVVRLKGGDPFVFGRGSEECEHLLPYMIEYEIIPGVSALLSALSYAGIPLTHRDYNAGFLVITGARAQNNKSNECYKKIAEEINFALKHNLLVVLFMSRLRWKHFSHLISKQDTPVAIIESGAFSSQRVFLSIVKDTQHIIETNNLKSPTLITLGENIHVRNQLKWFEKLPLFGTKIISFASKKLSIELGEMLSRLGADSKSYELYDLVPKSLNEIKHYFNSLSEYDYLVMTSRNAFDIFFSNLKSLEIDIRTIPRVIVTGEKTEEEFKKIGIYPDIVPKTFSSNGIIEELSNFPIKGKKFLFPKSSLSKGNLSSYIQEQKGVIDDFILYDNVPNKLTEEIIDEIFAFNPNYIIFTSSSSVDYYFKDINKGKSNFTAISIGYKTSESLRNHGITDILEPKSFTLQGIKTLLKKN